MSGPLKNLRHECLAQEKAKGTPGREALPLLGFSPTSGSAKEIWCSKKINDRVAELRGLALHELNAKATKEARIYDGRVAISIANLIAKAEEARVLAMEIKNPSAAVAAIREIGILSGARIEKHENTHRNVEQLTDAELAAYLTTNGSAGDPETTTH